VSPTGTKRGPVETGDGKRSAVKLLFLAAQAAERTAPGCSAEANVHEAPPGGKFERLIQPGGLLQHAGAWLTAVHEDDECIHTVLALETGECVFQVRQQDAEFVACT
jgi:hypothetical protein